MLPIKQQMAIFIYRMYEVCWPSNWKHTGAFLEIGLDTVRVHCVHVHLAEYQARKPQAGTAVRLKFISATRAAFSRGSRGEMFRRQLTSQGLATSGTKPCSAVNTKVIDVQTYRNDKDLAIPETSNYHDCFEIKSLLLNLQDKIQCHPSPNKMFCNIQDTITSRRLKTHRDFSLLSANGEFGNKKSLWSHPLATAAIREWDPHLATKNWCVRHSVSLSTSSNFKFSQELAAND